MQDEKDDVGAKAATGLLQICAAALTAGGSSPAEREFATACLGATEAAIASKRIDGVLEFGPTADEFNLQMDAIINSTNASRSRRMRSQRRVDLARDLDAAGLIVLDKRYVAGLFCLGLDLDLARERIQQLEDEAAERDAEIAGDAGDDDMARMIAEAGEDLRNAVPPLGGK